MIENSLLLLITTKDNLISHITILFSVCIYYIQPKNGHLLPFCKLIVLGFRANWAHRIARSTLKTQVHWVSWT